VAALCAILVGISVATATSMIDHARGIGAARYLMSRMALARAQAVARAAVVALRFEESARGTEFAVVVDGNENGVRTVDIDRGVDPMIEPPVLLSDLFPGSSIGLAPGVPGTEAVQLGGTSILSFTPNGTSTSGSVYVRGPDDEQWVIRVLGATARSRLLRFDTSRVAWVNVE
jgi:hypothetical protein